MQSNYTYKPMQFFLPVFLITGIAGFSAAYCSYHTELQVPQLVSMLVYLLAPCTVALALIFDSKNKELKKDFWARLAFSKIKLKYLPLIFLLMPLVLFIATLVSILLGRPAQQFALIPGFQVSLLLPLLLAPVFEELGWRGYGVDSLKAHFNLLMTSLLFALLWALWHVPLFFIKDFYQYELWHTNIFYAINFFMSMLPATILANWLYYKNNRSMSAAMLFHCMLNLCAVLFQTEQFTKCIVTLLLLVAASIIIVTDKKFFRS